MSRRPRVTWLLDSPDPSGSAVMAMRRMTVLGARHASVALALSDGTVRVPAGSPLHGIARVSGLAGELRIARSDVVVTTTERTLATAAPRLSPGSRLVHFVHTRPEPALRSAQVMRTLPRVSRLVVPVDVEPARFAQQVGLPPGHVLAADDFTLPSESLLGTARAKVIVAAGRLDARSGIVELAEAFRLALPDLPGWQLRVAGGGPALPELTAFVDRHALTQRLLVLGPRHDMAAQYLDAGLVVRIASGDACGLSVLEALAAGVPVLGCGDVPAVRRLVRHDINGHVLDRVDPVTVAAALVELARPVPRAELAAAARADRAGLISPAAARELDDLFASALDAPGHRPLARPRRQHDRHAGQRW